MFGLLERKLSELWNIIIVMAFECLYVCLLCLSFAVLLCLNCAFNILNGVKDFCKSSCEHYDDLGGSPTFCLLLGRCWTTGGGLWDKIRRELYADGRVIQNVIVFVLLLLLFCKTFKVPQHNVHSKPPVRYSRSAVFYCPAIPRTLPVRLLP
jgi:hypothetical protein